MSSDLRTFFEPRSVAILGATKDVTKPGYTIVRNLQSFGYSGKVFPVNPNADEVAGLRCYPNLDSIDDDVDLVVILISAERAVKAAEEIASRARSKHDCKAVICISGGFSELNTPEGRERERMFVDTLKSAGVRIMGPNCVGIIDCYSKFTTNFDVEEYDAGGVSLVSQSGALATAYIFWARPFRKIGLSKLVSLGNMSDVDIVECLQYLESDVKTKVIGVYLEGYREPRKLFEKMRQVSKKKPIVLLKAGRSEVGSKAALSHTASLTGDDRIYEGAARQVGVIRVKDVMEWYETIHFLEKQPIPGGNRVAVLTHIGGPGTLAVDAIGLSSSLKMANLSNITKNTIRSIVAPTATVANPDGYIDLTASHTEELHYKILKLLFDDNGVDAILHVLGPSRFLSQSLMAEKIYASFNEAGKRIPLLNVVTFDESAPECKLLLESYGLPTVPTPELAVKVLENMCWYSMRRSELETDDHPSLMWSKTDHRAHETNNRIALTEVEAYKTLEKYGIELATYSVATSIDEALRLAEEIGYPLVLKGIHKNLIHKTEAGAVVVGINGREELKNAARTIFDNVRKRLGGYPEGLLIQKMIKTDVEVFVGGVNDPMYGPTVSFGSGGILVELLKDVSFRLYPLSVSEALKMINETFVSKILKGFRGKPPKDVNALAELILKVGTILEKEEWITEIDLNPVMPLEKGCLVADARVVSLQ